MPRAKGSKNAKKPTPKDLLSEIDAPPVQFTSDAQDLFDKVKNRWVLDDVALRLLTCACESLSQSQRCAVVTSKEGISIRDRFDMVKTHPLAILERDHRNAAVSALSKLQASLE